MKIITLLALLALLSLLSFNIHAAEDCVSCTPPKPSGLKSYDEVQKEIAKLQTAVSPSCGDVLQAETDQEYKDHFSKLPKKVATIKGLKLQGSADELKFLTKMLGETPNDEWEKAKSCDTVLCALTKVYDSEEAAQRSLNIAKRLGYVASISKDFNFKDKKIGQIFSLEELQTIDLAYKKLPSTFKNLSSLDVLKRMPKGLYKPSSPNAAAYASPGYKSAYANSDGQITFVDGAFISDKAWGPHTAIHELTHHSDFSNSSKVSFGLSESPAYLKLSGWVKKSNYETDKSGKKTLVEKWEHAKDKKFITGYAASAPAEDLAESSSFYVYEPNKLKAIDPEKYEFIKKNVFGGKEYFDDPDFDLSKEDIFKRCLKDHREITLWGNDLSTTNLSTSCLDSFIKEQTFSDPKFCSYNKDQIKNYLFDKIHDSVDSASMSLKQCNTNLENNRKECLSENNFQKSCPIQKCKLNEDLNSKVRDSNSYRNYDNKALDSVKDKMGNSKFLTTMLIAGLSDKNGTSASYSLFYQKSFLEGASAELKKYYDKEGYKFDSAKEESYSGLQMYFIQNKKLDEHMTLFQKMVLEKATKSKEKNLELIQAWAASQSLEETPQFEDLAETMRKYTKGIFSK